VSALVAARIEHLADASGYESVALEGLEADRPLDTPPDGPPLPLVDWRARTLRNMPDTVFFLAPGDAADASRVAELAAGARLPVYPALLHGERLMALPTADPIAARQRGVECRASDPVSFALAGGREWAAFPELPGWSVRDAARRAVDEHLVRLRASAPYEPGAGVGLARLFAAGRAALMADTHASGAAALPLTATATARALVEDAGADPASVGDALGWYMDGRALGARTPEAVLAAMRAQMLALPSYSAEPAAAWA
jgi:hypothetical protein